MIVTKCGIKRYSFLLCRFGDKMHRNSSAINVLFRKWRPHYYDHAPWYNI